MLDNIFNRNQLNITPAQMKANNKTGADFNSVSRSINSFQTDKVSLMSPSLMGKAPVSLSAVSESKNGYKTPYTQIIDLGKRYNIPFRGDINSYQKEVIKAVIMHKAIQYDVPLNVALGIGGNESSWTMWSDVKNGKLEQCKNIRSGVLKSSDWGALQINDKAHPEAFPKAKYDLEFNIEYGLKYLSGRNNKIKGNMNLGFGEWDRTIASYNLGHNPTSKSDYEIANKYVSRVKSKSLRV